MAASNVKRSLLKRWREFAESSPIHGISYILTARRWPAIITVILLVPLSVLTFRETAKIVNKSVTEDDTETEIALVPPIPEDSEIYFCIVFSHSDLQKYLSKLDVSSVLLKPSVNSASGLEGNTPLLVASLALLAGIHNVEDVLQSLIRFEGTAVFRRFEGKFNFNTDQWVRSL